MSLLCAHTAKWSTDILFLFRLLEGLGAKRFNVT
jgi:hypothetical protein